MNAELVTALMAVIQGDALMVSNISTVEQSELLVTAQSIGQPLLVRRAATVRVLRDFIEGTTLPAESQAWASFVRRGFFATKGNIPIRPLDIKFEDACEDAISAAVSRLDEIGDLIDGEVSIGEALDLLQLLGEP